MKDLIENSVDALATVIEIKFTNYGLDGFEVLDNGFGIQENDLELFTKKHVTSKLNEYADLISVGTFGFRGEVNIILFFLNSFFTN